MDNLVAGVDTGVCAPGTNQIHGVVGDLCNRFGEFGFNRPDTGFLELPAVETATIVLKRKRYAPRTNGVIRGELLGFKKQERIREVCFCKNKAPA
jgi:hypothetical protein